MTKGILNQHYLDSLKTKEFKWGSAREDYYESFQQLIDKKWVKLSNGANVSELNYCCGVGTIGYLVLPEKLTKQQRDECVAIQISKAFENFNYVIYSGVVGQQPDGYGDLSTDAIRGYKLICASLHRFGFSKIAPAYPNRNTGNIIQIMGAMKAPVEDLEFND